MLFSEVLGIYFVNLIGINIATNDSYIFILVDFSQKEGNLR
jgi:hypothetical protein